MPTQLGTAVNFAFGSAAGLTISTPTLTGYLAQSLQHGLESDLAALRDGDGTTVNETFYDPRGTAELRVAISGSTIAVSRTNTTLDNFPSGTIVNITACAARPDLVESNWVVTEAGPRVEGGNTDVAMVVIPLRRRAGITAVATAS
jgi:hypothetical protein